MCTVSWLFRDDGFELYFNRDETRLRARALPPRRYDADDVAYLAPRDGDAGGTWIAANEHGLVVCLLNRYPEPVGKSYVSRGHLVRLLAACSGTDEVAQRLARLEDDVAPRYRPFSLLALEDGAAPLLTAWDGETLAIRAQPVVPPLSSSSFAPQAIGELRRRLWLEMRESPQPTAGELLAFHRSHRPRRGPYSPCMHRDDARTVSFTHVRVTPSAVEMAYADGPPCSAALGQPLTLMRQASRSPNLRYAIPVV